MTGTLKIEELVRTDRRVILFGTGGFAVKLNELFRLLGIRISYCLDNNKHAWDHSFYGVEIYNPEVLKKENKNNAIVIIASIFYEDISKQLTEYGFEENKDFFGGEAIMHEAHAYIENSVTARSIIGNMTGKRVILYGADKAPDKLFPMLKYLGLDAQYCVQQESGFNNGTCGLTVKCLEALREEDDGAFILIFSDRYYEVINTLRGYGYSEFINCYNGNKLYNLLFEEQELLNIILKDYSAKNTNCFFIQIGANDGIKHDPLREFILRNNWKGILIEPVKYIFEKLKSNYSESEDLIFENVAISDKNEWRDFYYFREESDNDLEGDYPEYGTFIFEQIEEWLAYNKKSKQYLIKEKLLCLTLNSLLEKYNVQKYDVLCIDVEGYDYEILKSVDLSIHKPDIIIYETNHLIEADRLGSFQLLGRHGYRILEIGIDAVAIK